MTTLYLIRHGETVWNADGRFQGHQNSPLNDVGRAQAQMVAQAMATYQLDAIYTSDLDRAAETAEAVAVLHQRTPVKDIRLREACFGEWEGYTMTEITERWPEVVTAWRADSLRTRPPGGETLEIVQQRVTAVVDEIVSNSPDGKVAIVGHGGSMRAVVALALGADLSIFRHLRLDNCSISTIQVMNGHYSLVHLNDICHLRQEEHASLDEAGDQWRIALSDRKER
ncbi:MAG TPA: histidine phosphatase family protein [Armatimonadota bacterium]|nr:histidine phosphatase family protein [Armatimonadota bacterium]